MPWAFAELGPLAEKWAPLRPGFQREVGPLSPASNHPAGLKRR